MHGTCVGMWPPRVGEPMTKPAALPMASLTSSSDAASRFSVFTPTPTFAQGLFRVVSYRTHAACSPMMQTTPCKYKYPACCSSNAEGMSREEVRTLSHSL